MASSAAVESAQDICPSRAQERPGVSRLQLAMADAEITMQQMRPRALVSLASRSHAHKLSVLMVGVNTGLPILAR